MRKYMFCTVLWEFRGHLGSFSGSGFLGGFFLSGQYPKNRRLFLGVVWVWANLCIVSLSLLSSSTFRFITFIADRTMSIACFRTRICNRYNRAMSISSCCWIGKGIYSRRKYVGLITNKQGQGLKLWQASWLERLVSSPPYKQLSKRSIINAISRETEGYSFGLVRPSVHHAF